MFFIKLICYLYLNFVVVMIIILKYVWMSIFFFVYRYSGNLSVVGGILIVDFIIVGKKVIFWFRVKVSYWFY